MKEFSSIEKGPDFTCVLPPLRNVSTQGATQDRINNAYIEAMSHLFELFTQAFYRSFIQRPIQPKISQCGHCG